LQRRLPEELRGALVLQHQQPALDRAHGGRRDVAVAQAKCCGVLAYPDQQRLYVLQIEQRQPLFIRHAKRDVEDALLRLRELQKLRQQQRPHLGHRGADRVALLAQDVPEGHRKGAVGVIVEADLCRAFGKGRVQLALGAARAGKAREVALHVRQEYRHPRGGKSLGQDLQGHGLARARRPRHQPVPVCIAEVEVLFRPVVGPAAAEEDVVRHLKPLQLIANRRVGRAYYLNLFAP
jgi:hypothetical protein